MVNHLVEFPLGLHCLIIYPDLTTLREFYSYYIQKQIKEKKELVFVSPFYETTDSVRHNLSNGYKTIDVDKYERQEKKLVIMDSLDKYLGQNKGKGKGDKGKVSISGGEDVVVTAAVAVVGDASNGTVGSRVKVESQWWSYNEQMIKHAAKMGNRGLSILGDMGAFYYMGKAKELLEYESSLPKQFDANLNLNLNLNLKGLCLYHQTDFDKLSEEQKQKLVKHHGMAVLLQAH